MCKLYACNYDNEIRNLALGQIPASSGFLQRSSTVKALWFSCSKTMVLNLRQLIEHVTQPNISSSERLSVSLLYTLKARWACLEPETLRTRPRSPPHASTINSICTGKSGNQMRQAANSLGETYSRGLRGTHTCVGPARGLTKNHRSN